MERLFPGFGDDDKPDAPALPSDPDALASPGVGEQRFALLIGNAAYKGAALRNPVRDTRLVGEALRQLGFSVTRIENATLAEMRSALATFERGLLATDPASVAMVYFAGHGVQGGGVNYLIPVDADPGAPGDLATRALPLDEVVALLSRRPRRANILVLDACRSRTAPEDAASGFSGGLAALDLPPAGMLVAYSTAAGRGAEDGAGRNSPYAAALVENLPGMLEPGRRVHDVFVDTADRVRAVTGGKQNPALFLQGGLPALTLAPQDEDRRSRYDPWGPARARRVALLTGGSLLAAVTLGLLALIWTYLAPIDQRLLLSFVRLADPPGIGLSCTGTPDATQPDAYGLTAAEWCQLMPGDLYAKAASAPDLVARVDAGFSNGDPKALFLTAQREIEAAPDLPGAAYLEVEYFLSRAARAGLPVAALSLDLLALRETSPRWVETLDQAAADGHVASQARVTALDIAAGDAAALKAGILNLEDLRARDPSGFTDLVLSDLYWGIVTPAVERNPALSGDYVLAAARKGYVPAIDTAFDMEDHGDLVIAEADRDRLMQRLLQVGREAGYWWKYGKLYQAETAADDAAALALLREMMDRFPYGPAALRFADLVSRGIGGPVAPGEVAAALEQAVAAGSEGARQLRGAYRMGLYQDADHNSLVPIDPAGALADLTADYDLYYSGSALDLAQYHLRGIAGHPDPEAALPFLQQALASVIPEEQAGARALITAIGTAKALAPDLSPADLTLGEADAPVTVTLYIDPDCADCNPGDLTRALQGLQASYVRLGLARLQIRPVVAEGASPSALLRMACLQAQAPEVRISGLFQPRSTPASCDAAPPADQLLALNQNRWDMLRAQVLAPGAPIAPQELLWDGGPRRPVTRPKALPVFVVDGWVVSDTSPLAVEETIFRLLSPARQAMAWQAGQDSCKGRVRSQAEPPTTGSPAPFKGPFCPPQ